MDPLKLIAVVVVAAVAFFVLLVLQAPTPVALLIGALAGLVTAGLVARRSEK